MGDLRRNEFGHGGRGGGGNRAGVGRSSRSQSRGDRSRRAWTDREEMWLLATLKELVATGWKSDNGFRSGYLFKLEESMRREFPNSNLRVSPHITSKLHTWKKSYSAVATILEKSGVGFNIHGDYKIDCDENQWAEITKADSAARLVRYKSWPYYEDWKMVFGKDRATGHSAQDTDQANATYEQGSGSRSRNIGGLNANNGTPEDFYEGDRVDDQPSLDDLTDSVFSNAVESEGTARPAKKRKRGDSLDGLVEVISKLHEDTNARLDHHSTRIGYEFDVTKARKELFQMMGLIPGLTLAQVFIASDAILAKGERLDYFMSLPEGARQAYVWHALEHYTAN